MAVAIRLQRTGKPKDAHYRIVAIEKVRASGGRALEVVGHYHPRQRKEKEVLFVNMERVEHWLKNGALPSETAASLIKRAKNEKKA